MSGARLLRPHRHRAALLVLLLAAATPARAFVRSTTSGGNPSQGACLLWSQKGLTYQLNASAFASTSGCADPAAAARTSFPRWTQATQAGAASPCTDFAFSDGGNTATTALGNDGVNLVVFRRGLCSAITSDPNCPTTASETQQHTCIKDHNCWSHGDGTIIALTTATFRVSTGEVLDADMELHGWNGSTGAAATGWYFTCAPAGAGPCAAQPFGSSGCNYVDVAGTVLHEAGHMLGLDHVCQPGTSCDPLAVMFPTASLGVTPRRALTADDVAGVCAIYPAGQPASATAGCLGQAAAASSSSGCGAGGAGGLALAGIGLWLALRRRGRVAGPGPDGRGPRPSGV